MRRRFGGTLSGLVPGPSLVVRQMLTTAADLICSCLALYVLLPQGAPSFPVFFAIYVVAIAAGVVSHVPAGLGVFETIVIAAMPASVPTDVLLSLALLVYRLVYHVGPLGLAAVLVAVSEGRELARRPATRRTLEAGARMAPIVLSAMTVLAGVMNMIFQRDADAGSGPRLHRQRDPVAAERARDRPFCVGNPRGLSSGERPRSLATSGWGVVGRRDPYGAFNNPQLRQGRCGL